MSTGTAATTPCATTLADALRATAQARWAGRRGHAVNTCQSRQAIADLASVVGTSGPGDTLLSDVTPEHVRAAVKRWQEKGLSASTINKRVGCLGMMGVPAESCFVRPPRHHKWWLRPEDERALVLWLAKRVRAGEPGLKPVIWYLLWATRTGLRVEETLRLRRSHFMDLWGGRPSVQVPGTKTEAAGNVTLALSTEAAQVAREAFGRAAAPSVPMIPMTYDQLWRVWQQCKAHLGVTDNRLATLRSCRRSAARALHTTAGMPLDMVRQYLRHTDIKTTMGYLRLTGGYGEDEFRRWLR